MLAAGLNPRGLTAFRPSPAASASGPGMPCMLSGLALTYASHVLLGADQSLFDMSSFALRP